MRIGVMPNVFPKVSKTFVLDQIIGMMNRGHDVFIFAPESPVEPVQQDEVSEYNLYDKTTYFSSPDSTISALFGAAANTVSLVSQSPANGIEILRTAYKKGIQDAGSFTYHVQPIMEANLDILHAHFGPIGQQAVAFKRMGACDALVTSFHGWGIREAEEQGGELYTELFAHCDQIIANTDYTRKKILEFGADSKQTSTHHIGINPEKFVPPTRKDKSIPTTILTVARLDEIKGLRYGISAFDRISSQLRDTRVEYRIVGDGPLRSTLQKQVNEYDLGETVTLCGAKDQSGVIEEMQAADIFLLPSMHEGFGRVLIEAQATELPVVASDVGGVREATSPEESALLVPPADVSAIATALTDLIQDPPHRTEMGHSGRRYVRKNFDITQLNNQLESTYAKLL